MNPAFLLGIAFKIPYNSKKYHSGTICKGVTKILEIKKEFTIPYKISQKSIYKIIKGNKLKESFQK